MPADASPVGAPVIIFSFARPEYLARLCASLRSQQGVSLRDDQVHLVQDGAVSPRSRLRYAEEARLEEVMAAFRAAFPGGHVHRAPHNLGIAMNLLRGEKLAFETLGAETGYFFEEDLELGPHYLAMLERMRAAAEADPRIGYFACYGDHRIASDPARPRYVPLEHHWGFGLTRRCWQAMQPWLAPFYKVWGETDYQARPHLRIVKAYLDKRVASTRSSQDVAKTAACADLGFARINTDVCYARYIGAQGESFRAASFEQRGFDRMSYAERLPDSLPPPGEDEVARFIEGRWEQFRQQRAGLDAAIKEMSRKFADPDRPATREEVEQLWWLLMDRLPEDDGFYERTLAERRTVRQVRTTLLRSREGQGKTFILPYVG